MFYVLLRALQSFEYSLRRLPSDRARRSPSMFVHQIVIASNAPGKISVQGADSIDCVPSAMITPQLVSGSWIPKPKKLMKLSARITPGIVNVAYTRAGPNTLELYVAALMVRCY